MRILILGAGGVGGYFGGRLASVGADVTFLVRARRAAQLAQDGLVVRSPLGDLRLQVRTVERAEPRYELIILSCKAYDLEEAMNAVAPAVGPGAYLLPLLNGLRHLDALDARFSESQVLGGCCHIGVTLTGRGEIDHLNEVHRLILGPRRPEQEAACCAIHRTLALGGFAPEFSPSILQEMWEKFAFLAAYAGITCLMRAPIGVIASTDEGAAIAFALLEECAAVAAAWGYPLRAEFLSGARAAVTDRRSAGASSMLRDMLRGGKTENDHILGDMQMRAIARGVATPVLRIAHAHLQAYEAIEATRQSFSAGNDTPRHVIRQSSVD
jgi:2-dehydropantoate 2-reductase